jgi:hypothetical protein
MLDAHARFARDGTRSLELHFPVGAKVEHHLKRLVIDEPPDVAWGE